MSNVIKGSKLVLVQPKVLDSLEFDIEGNLEEAQIIPFLSPVEAERNNSNN